MSNTNFSSNKTMALVWRTDVNSSHKMIERRGVGCEKLDYLVKLWEWNCSMIYFILFFYFIYFFFF